MFSAYHRTTKFLSSSAKKVILCSLPKKGFFLRRISSNSFTAHSCSAQSTVLPDSSKLYSAEASALVRKSTFNRKKKEVNRSYTVTYLIDSCGLSPEAAISASEKVHFTTPDRPNSVLSVLKNHGFTKAEISSLVRQDPMVLLADAEKSLLPKFQFYQSIGFSKTDMAKFVIGSPNFWRTSLKNHIIPTYNFFKSVVSSDQNVCLVFQRFPPREFSDPCTEFLVPNIALLRKLEVPETRIAHLLTNFPEAVARRPEEFSETVSTVKKMGFSPQKSAFVQAVQALSGKSNALIWDRCYKTYTKWGWSNDDIILVFKKCPKCMIMSEKKINRTMEFLVNKMGYPSRKIGSPPVLHYSLENRIIPRCSVILVLIANGLLQKDLSLETILGPSTKLFLKRYVTKYKMEVPWLLSIYEGKEVASDLNFDCHIKQGKIKINTDGSRAEREGLGGIGGVFRNETRRWISGHMGNIGRRSILEAELQAICQGLVEIHRKNMKKSQ